MVRGESRGAEGLKSEGGKERVERVEREGQ
jgi:hypothetical protein